MNYHKANTLEITTQVKKLNFTSHSRNPSICPIPITAPSHPLEVTIVLVFIVIRFLCYFMVLSLSCATLDLSLVLNSFFLLSVP